jgi:hypothetical protein
MLLEQGGLVIYQLTSPLPFTLTGGVLALLTVARFWTAGVAMAEENSAQAATKAEEPFMMNGCQSGTLM